MVNRAKSDVALMYTMFKYEDWEKALSLASWILQYEKARGSFKRKEWRKMGAEKELNWMKEELGRLQKSRAEEQREGVSVLSKLLSDKETEEEDSTIEVKEG